MSDKDLTKKATSDLFTAVLWSAPKNEPLLRSFINAVLTDAGMSPIAKATVMNPFNVKDHAFDKEIVLDVRVSDELGHLYDIEIQVSGHPAFPNRVLYYWSDTYSSQLESGTGYAALCPVISIILTEFPIFPQLNCLHNVFQLAARENPDVLLTDHLQIHFVRLSELLKGHWEKLEGIRRELQRWINFFVFAAIKTENEMSNITDNDPAIREAYAQLQSFYSDPELREHERRRRRFLVDYNLGMNASKAEGRAEAIILILTRRFGSVPQSLHDKLLAMTDIDQLDRLTNLVLDCESLADFEKGLVLCKR